jgi:hypothetical protein
MTAAAGFRASHPEVIVHSQQPRQTHLKLRVCRCCQPHAAANPAGRHRAMSCAYGAQLRSTWPHSNPQTTRPRGAKPSPGKLAMPAALSSVRHTVKAMAQH